MTDDLDKELRAILVEAMGDFPTEHLLDYHKNRLKALLLEHGRKEIDRYIQPYLDYCQEANGMPHCKNCGLESQNTTKERATIRNFRIVQGDDTDEVVFTTVLSVKEEKS